MYLVFDIGGSSTKVAIMDTEGNILERSGNPQIPPDADDAREQFLASLVAYYHAYRYKYTIKGIAIDLPGQIDVENGIVYGGGALPYNHELALGPVLSSRCDNIPVAVENDGKAAALAEVWKGNAKDVQNAVVIAFGTGMGGALVKDRKVIHGTHMSAGEVSFLCTMNNRKELSDFINGIGFDAIGDTPHDYDVNFWCLDYSTTVVCNRLAYRKGLKPGSINGKMIYEMVDAGDADAISIMEDMYFSIAKQCANLQLIFDPDVILIGGGISANPHFVEGIRRYAEDFKKVYYTFQHINVKPCAFHNDSNMIGALYNFKQKYEGVI